jgi:hypothetical protein
MSMSGPFSSFFPTGIIIMGTPYGSFASQFCSVRNISSADVSTDCSSCVNAKHRTMFNERDPSKYIN